MVGKACCEVWCLIVGAVLQAGYTAMVQGLCDSEVLQEYVESPQEVVDMILAMHKGADSDASSFVHQENPFLERPYLTNENVLRIRLKKAEKLLNNTVSVYNALSPQVGGVHRKRFTFSVPRHKLQVRQKVAPLNSPEQQQSDRDATPQLQLSSRVSKRGSPKEAVPSDTTILNSLILGSASADASDAREEFRKDLERNRSFYSGYGKAYLKQGSKKMPTWNGSPSRNPTYSQVFNLADLDFFEKDVFVERKYQARPKFIACRAPSPVVRMEVVRGQALSTVKVVKDHLSQMCNNQLRQLQDIKLHDIL
eukprot:768805-Hanusia_phi.AAC.9